jgi:DNA-binding MarR family transcriptional regulator
MSEVHEFRSFNVRRLLQAHTALWHSTVSTEVTSVQFGVLLFLTESVEVGQRELMHLAQVDKSTLAELLLRMERHGLLSTRRSESDRRCKTVTITEKGRQLLTELLPGARRVNELLTQNLNAEQRETFDSLLAAILHDVDLPAG